VVNSRRNEGRLISTTPLIAVALQRRPATLPGKWKDLVSSPPFEKKQAVRGRDQGYGHEACQFLGNEDRRVAAAFGSTCRTDVATISLDDCDALVP
jgi:hypothetical protein